jgi:CheY-like chemotaxis protein
VGGAAGLLLVQHQGPFAVVVSDMKMPGMDGIEFLLKVKSAAPDTIRIMLTGQTDLQTAIDAVNEGSIFRFLSKPCSKEVLASTLTEGLAQYRLVCTERQLTDQTLRGTVFVLTEVLNLLSPAAFSRAARVRRYVQHVAACLSLENPWRIEVAAMMSQLGCITLDPATIEAAYSGSELAPEQRTDYLAHPLVAEELLKNIPRMEAVAWMIAHQNQPLPPECNLSDREMAEKILGAQILRAALTFDVLLRKGRSRAEAALSLTRRGTDARIVQAMLDLEPEIPGREIRTVPIAALVLGSVVEEDLRGRSGILVVVKGQEITSPVLLRLKNFFARGEIAARVAVSPPRPA